MNDAPLRFLLADDHAVVRAGVEQILSAEFNVTFLHAENASDALDVARHEKPDLILLDVSLPGRSGLDVLGELKSAQPQTPILILSMHAEEQFALRALRGGASGYVTKSTVPTELVQAVKKVLEGGHYVSASLAEVLAAAMASASPDTALSHETLSPREFEVLRMIALGKSGKEIAAELSLSFKTVSTYRTRVSEKLHLRTNADMTQYCLRHGLIQ
jgi:DNA-binding NarL/FixJ family response regulator